MTRTRNDRVPQAVATFKDRDAFIRDMMADRGMTMGERAIIARLALHFDVEDGSLCIDYWTVGKDVGVCERTAMRAAAKAEARGWIRIEHRPGRTNNFHLIMNPGGVTT